MRKLLIVVMVAICLVGYSAECPEYTTYIASGHYYASGEIITEDGNIWGYVSGTSDYDNKPVNVLFDDMGTPDNIYDDEIIGLTERR